MPVLRDDQHGTAVVVLAVLLTIAERMELDIPICHMGILGLGAAGTGIAKLLRAYGVTDVSGTDLRDGARERLAGLGSSRMIEELWRPLGGGAQYYALRLLVGCAFRGSSWQVCSPV